MSNTERLLFEVLKSLQELQSEVTEIKKNTDKLTVDIAEIKSKLDMEITRTSQNYTRGNVALTTNRNKEVKRKRKEDMQLIKFSIKDTTEQFLKEKFNVADVQAKELAQELTTGVLQEILKRLTERAEYTL